MSDWYFYCFCCMNHLLGVVGYSSDILEYIIIMLLVYIQLSVYSPFSDTVGLPTHNAPFPGVLMKSIGAAFFNDRLPFLTSTTNCKSCRTQH